jgi:HAD superfamily hydrolase (TIGR01484 family)
MSKGMAPLDSFPAERCRGIDFVMCDIDDTLTTDGRLLAASFSAMEQLQRAGLVVLPITGRPAGWCDHIARMWPVDGIVGENGAFYFRYDPTARRMIRAYWMSAEERATNRRRLEALKVRILSEVPGSAVASDQHYREADLAIDYCEDVSRLPPTEVERIVALFEESGATAKVSSIHVNGWFGNYDKLSMARRMLSECHNVDADAERDSMLFVGDSPNDAPMFSYFPNSVGVANVRDFADRLSAEPAYVTRAPGALGFAELADALLSVR